MVTLFLDRGARINNRNNKGRTPLMEAALWGRFENTQILLARGADKEAKDREGRKAIDFTSQSDVNAEERHIRAGGVYKEDTFVADKERKTIARVLRGTVISALTLDLSTPKNSSCEHHSFHNSSRTSEIVLSAPVATFPVRSLAKTIAQLVRGSPFPPVDAMSGWAHYDEQNTTISGKNWTNEVFVICESIGHILAPVPEIDQGRPGRWHACHAEKQLVAFFVAYHVFLKDELLNEDEIEEEKSKYEDENILRPLRGDITQEQHNRWREQMERKEERNLKELYLVRPPVTLQEATILVSRVVCADCETFVRQVELVLGLSFRLQRC